MSADASLLQRVPAIIYVAEAGMEGRWEYVSPQIETILGYTPEEWCADPLLWAACLHPEDREATQLEEEQTIESGLAEGASEYRLRRGDGTYVWVRDEATVVTGEGEVPRWHGVIFDINERKLAELELERRAAQQAAVARLGEHALEGASTSDLMQEAVAMTSKLLEVDIVGVLELLGDRDRFAIRVAHGGETPPPTVPAGRRSQAGYTILTGAPVVTEDLQRETRFQPAPGIVEQGIRSGLTVPIVGRQSPFGVLTVQSRRQRHFRGGDVDFVQSVANVLGDAFERQLTDDDIRHRALHDPLTALPNRVLFIDRLEHALERVRRRGRLVAILLLDLDRFQLINDSLGHQVGDELLAAAAPRLRQAVRSSDTVARFGGDEFGVLLEEIGGELDAIEMAQRLAGIFNRPFVLEGTEHFVTTSIGIVLAGGGELPEDLIRDADAAMHRAKERGRARYELFDEAIRGRAITRLRVENDLRRALERDELTLDYQPLIRCENLEMFGVEALVRWEHPERGRIAPLEFISVAEENGLIEPIGRWVLEQSCRQAARWGQMHPEHPLMVGLNLSPVQIAGRGLADTVSDALRGSGLDPGLLVLEITESSMLTDAEELIQTLAALKRLGIKLALDDFGTGYSSLAYLTRLPLDAIKVDRSFVSRLGAEPRASAITEAIVAMSHALSLKVIGEGVETAAQMDELMRLGCDGVQGFHFCGPRPAGDITRMLQGRLDWLPEPHTSRAP